MKHIRQLSLLSFLVVVFGASFSLISSAATPATPPSYYTGGIFGHYFQNIVEGSCQPGEGVVGFDTTYGSSYGTPRCQPIAGGSSYWIKSGVSIYYTGGNVGIGTVTPGSLLEVIADAKINGLTIGRGGGNIESNTANGFQSLYFNTTGFENTANGANSLASNTLGYRNTANGSYALYANTIGSYNTADGWQALYSNTTGSGHTALGYGAAQNIVATFLNVPNTAIGYQALHGGDATTPANNIAYDNVAIGYQALYGTPGVPSKGGRNVAVGNNALSKNTTGGTNTAVGGNGTLSSNTIGNQNIAIGAAALMFSITGNNNTAIGESALLMNTTGNNNTGLGFSALRDNATGNFNTAIGYGANVSVDGLTNATAIGYNTQVAASNAMILGNGVNVGIGTSSPAYKLTVSGGAFGGNYAIVPNYTSWNAYGVGDGGAAIYNDASTFKKLMIVGNNSAGGSREVGIWDNLTVVGNTTATAYYYSSDRRLKEDIVGIDSSLEKIKQLEGVSFRWKKDGTPAIGFIAQDVEKVFPEVVSTDAMTGYKAVQYGNLLAPTVDAVKELSDKVDALEKVVERQDALIRQLEARNNQ